MTVNSIFSMGYNICPIVVVQMGLIRYLQQWSMDPCGKTHMGCMWDPFWVLWATRKGYMVLDVRNPVLGGGEGAGLGITKA